VGAPSAAKTGAARGRSRTRRRRERLLPLLPLLPRRRAAAFVFLPVDEPHHHTSPTPALRPVATQGEDDCFPAHVDAPAFAPRWNAQSLRAAAPSLVMPAFVPGWDKLACRCRCHRRRALALLT
jgi:hypothetical protein